MIKEKPLQPVLAKQITVSEALLRFDFPNINLPYFLYLAQIGTQPWQNEPLTEFDAGFANNFWVPGTMSATEQFVMFSNAADDFAVGVYNPGITYICMCYDSEY